MLLNTHEHFIVFFNTPDLCIRVCAGGWLSTDLNLLLAHCTVTYIDYPLRWPYTCMWNSANNKQFTNMSPETILLTEINSDWGIDEWLHPCFLWFVVTYPCPNLNFSVMAWMNTYISLVSCELLIDALNSAEVSLILITEKSPPPKCNIQLIRRVALCRI